MIKGSGRSLLIDTGFGREECRTALFEGLRELGIAPHSLDLFLTHMHADHSGLASDFATFGAKVLMSRVDAAVLVNGIRWDAMGEHAKRHGFPAAELEQAIAKHPARRFGLNHEVEFAFVQEGDFIEYNGYSLRAVFTPGHTMGHLCLYEPYKKILVSGDHILDHITPNISLFSDTRNALKEYLESLEKVSRLDVQLVLPGHRNSFTHFQKRIRQLRKHHYLRCREIIKILDRYGAMSGYEVASRMRWALTYERWEQFPVSQKWFACGEALSHLKYLEAENKVKNVNGVWERCERATLSS